MSGEETLGLHCDERDALLEQAIGLLHSDDRVVASWLYGSLGRGDEDDLSDIDLWVVVADEHMHNIRTGRHEHAARLGAPLLTVDAPQNAPEGGAFLSVVYGGFACGPQHVDWTWQAQSQAGVPHDARLLFDKVGLPRAEAPQPPDQAPDSGRAAEQVRFFWMMLPVAAKYAARQQPWAAANIITLLRYTMDEIGWLLGGRGSKPVFPTKISAAVPGTPPEQFTMLQGMVGEMRTIISDNGSLVNSLSEEAERQISSWLLLLARSR